MEEVPVTPTISEPKLGRWVRIVVLGCALGLVFVALSLAIIVRLEQDRLSAPFQLSAEAVKGDVTRVIDLQLSAFRAGDYRGAYFYADSTLQHQFGPAAFEQMVRESYPAIAASRLSNFGVILDNGGTAIVMVSIAGKSGTPVHYQYILRREKGHWRVSGVTRVRVGENVV